MRELIVGKLWMGNTQDIQDVRSVLSLGVRAIIDVAANETPVLYPRDISYCRLPINDGWENDQALLRLAVYSAAEFLRVQTPTLIVCSAGMNRSPSIAAAALAIVAQLGPDEALLQIAANRPIDVAPAFWNAMKRAVFRRGRPGRILFCEYGTILFLTENDRLVLNVLCGGSAQWGVEFDLNEREIDCYKRFGDTFIQELAESVRTDNAPYKARDWRHYLRRVRWFRLRKSD